MVFNLFFVKYFSP